MPRTPALKTEHLELVDEALRKSNASAALRYSILRRLMWPVTIHVGEESSRA